MVAKKQRDALPLIIPSEFTARPKPGFVQIPVLCLSLPGNAIKVWLAARDHYDKKKRHSWQSHEVMATELKMSKSSVKRAVSLLVDEGWMVSVGQKYPGKGNTNCLIALTKPATPEEIRSWTHEHQSAQSERVHFGSQKSSNLTPKEFKSEDKRVQIDTRTTSIEQHLPATPMNDIYRNSGGDGIVATETLTEEERVSNPSTLATTTPTEPQFPATGEESSLVDSAHLPGDAGCGDPSLTETRKRGAGRAREVIDRLAGGQA